MYKKENNSAHPELYRSISLLYVDYNYLKQDLLIKLVLSDQIDLTGHEEQYKISPECH